MVSSSTISSPSMPTAKTPLLSPSDNDERQDRSKSQSCDKGDSFCDTDHSHVQFYKPESMLQISREVAFGYLILLTGGDFTYAPPSLEDAETNSKKSWVDNGSGNIRTSKETDNCSTSGANSDVSSSPINVPNQSFGEETASLAYAAIVDGNVLDACFGLNSSAGSIGVGSSRSRKKRNKLFCCFNSSASSQSISSTQRAKIKSEMNRTAEVLREVRELHHDSTSLESTSEAQPPNETDSTSLSNSPIYIQIIHAYITAFALIVKYHDEIQLRSKQNKPRKSICTSITRLECLKCVFPMCGKVKTSDVPSNQQTQHHQKKTLDEIAKAFQGLNETISKGLEKEVSISVVTDIASGVSVVE